MSGISFIEKKLQSNYIYTTGLGIIPYGSHNILPNLIYDNIKFSPTTKGCVDVINTYTIGKGFKQNGDNEINSEGKTWNFVLSEVSKSIAKYGGYALHFDTNIYGKIAKITPLDFRFFRVKTCLEKIRFANYSTGISLWTNSTDEFDRFFLNKELAPIKDFFTHNGFILYDSMDTSTYPESPMESISTSAEFEKAVQTFSLSNIKNGFSASGLLKFATGIGNAEQNEEQRKNRMTELQKLRGDETAGSILAVEIPANMQGEASNINLFEPFTPTSIDKLFEVQKKTAKDMILRNYNVPEVLLGTMETGMFNQESLLDSSSYMNSKVRKKQKYITDIFNKIKAKSIFEDNIPFEIVPLDYSKEFKNKTDGAIND